MKDISPCKLLIHVRAQSRLGSVPLGSVIHLHCFPAKSAAYIVPAVNFKIRFLKPSQLSCFMLLDNGELLSQLRVSLAKMPSPGCNGTPIASAWLFPKAGVNHA